MAAYRISSPSWSGGGGPIRWRSWLPTLLALLVVAGTVSLGNWQTRRAEYKAGLQARMDAAARQAPVEIGPGEVDGKALDLHPVRVRGRWIEARTVLLDNRLHQGRPGYMVVTPLCPVAAEGPCTLVLRGWMPQGADRRATPAVATPAGVVDVTGRARVPPERVYELSAHVVEGRVWQNLTLERFRAWSGLSLQPVWVEQSSDSPDGLVREWEKVDARVERHLGYALQWYALAVLTGVLWGFFTWRAWRLRTEGRA